MLREARPFSREVWRREEADAGFGGDSGRDLGSVRGAEKAFRPRGRTDELMACFERVVAGPGCFANPGGGSPGYSAPLFQPDSIHQVDLSFSVPPIL